MIFSLKCLVAILTSFAVAMIFAPLVIGCAKKMKAGQPILHYVEQHKAKAGTPTMGGIIFIVPAVIVTVIFCNGGFSMGIICGLVMLSYGILGFLDDFIKIKTKNNGGLKPYQKIIGQLSISIIVALYCYRNIYIGSAIYLPFIEKTWDFGWGYIVFAIFIFLSLSNSVNLTDGLDGLAGGCSAVYLLTFIVILFWAVQNSEYYGQVVEKQQLTTLAIFAASLLGGVMAFLLFNSHKASIFMGDTGSMALGGASACIALFCRNPLLILMVGIMYIVSCITIIIQVAYFKLTHGKRVFLMAPFHHHLEMKGHSETKIVALYTTCTALAGIIAIISVLVGCYGFEW